MPLDLQLQLVDRVVRYERVWAADPSPLGVLVLRRAGAVESERASAGLVQLLNRAGRLGGRPITVTERGYDGTASLLAQCDRERVLLVYLAPGLGAEVGNIVRAVAGRTILVVSTVGADVDRGAMVGFELAGARPRIAIHLASTRAAGRRFDAQFLRLARVVE